MASLTPKSTRKHDCSLFLSNVCAFAQLSTLGSLRQVGEKLSKGRDLEIIMSRERLTEGIRLYVSAKLLARIAFLPNTLVGDIMLIFFN